MTIYQDTETGKLYDLPYFIDLSTYDNPRIPKTLTDKIIEKPSDDHFWYLSGWVHMSELPEGYQEPITKAPIFNPAWVVFLFPLGTFVWPDDEGLLNYTLDDINNHRCDWRRYKRVSMSLKIDDSHELPILISHDGALALALNSETISADKAVEKINFIKGALFLGGLTQIEATDYKNLEVGSLSIDDDLIESYVSSHHNRLRNNGLTKSENILLLNPNYINVSTIKSSYITGCGILKIIDNLMPDFIVKGHSALVSWNLSDALSNLWIVVEQIIQFILDKKIGLNINDKPEKIRKEYEEIKDSWKNNTIKKKIDIAKNAGCLSKGLHSNLNKSRISRNKLAHSGITPELVRVETLWFDVLDLIHVASNVSLNNLIEKTSQTTTKPYSLKKIYPPRLAEIRDVERLDFVSWEKYKK